MMEIEPVVLQNAEIPDVDREQFNIELQKYYSKHNENSKKLKWSRERIQSVIKLLDDFSLAKSEGRRPTNQEYHYTRKYEAVNIGNQRVLIVKRKHSSDPVVQIVPTEEFYDRILEAHLATGHGRRDKIVLAFKDKYIILVNAITIFLNLCKTCLPNRSYPRRGILVKTLIADDLSNTVQTDHCETIPDIKEEITNNCEDDENGPVSPSPSSSSSQHCETLPDWKRRRIIQDDNDRTEVVSTLCGTFNDLNAKKLAAEDLKIKILEDELRFKKELQQLQLEIARKELAIKTEVYNQVRDGTMNPHNLIGFTKHD
ncbi:KRAB-A domain-containing protein 2-like isoform X1 [Anticarsia gemmatalis]|uniref:KRAB-A domain-containing protein 2-like isoform X1 n=1 Tax=Anticarsia gemmatalis TaxID=129554 RepID=UPI003F758ACE